MAKKKTARKQSSASLSSLAAKVLRGEKIPTIAEAKRLAACVLSQDETTGQKKKVKKKAPTKKTTKRATKRKK